MKFLWNLLYFFEDCSKFSFFFIVDSSDVYTWGHGVNGRLGHGDEADHLVPKVVQTLLGKEIRGVSCGPSHTAAINVSGELFTWGAGRCVFIDLEL